MTAFLPVCFKYPILYMYDLQNWKYIRMQEIWFKKENVKKYVNT